MTQAASEMEVVVPDAPEGEDQQQVEGAQPGDGEQGQSEEAEGVVISIGDESPPSEEDETQQAPDWVKTLRKDHRESQRRERELKAEIERLKAPKAEQLGEKPTLAGCDYDEDKFESELDAWKGRKAKQDAEAEQKRKGEEKAQADYQTRLQKYATGKADLKLDDFEDAEAVVKQEFSPQQQAYIIAAADKSAQVIYALGKYPKEAARIAAITDPVQFVAAVVRLETQLKVTTRKAAPLPEGTVRGGAPVRSSDQNLAKLEAEADRTGDRSKVIAYRRQQQTQKRA